MAVAAVDKRPAAWFAEPAKRWLSKALQTFEKAFLAALTPANRNRLLKRLYGLWTSRQKCELPRP